MVGRLTPDDDTDAAHGLLASRGRHHGEAPISPAALGWNGVIERLRTALSVLNAPKPDSNREQSRYCSVFAHEGVGAPSCKHPAGVKSQAKGVLQNLLAVSVDRRTSHPGGQCSNHYIRFELALVGGKR
jgi:hypothetical protein